MRLNRQTFSLRRYGATEAEIQFLQDRRVELNQMTSRQLIDWIEGKLRDHGVAKLVPDENAIGRAAHAYACTLEANRILKEMTVEPGPLPPSEALREAVVQALEDGRCAGQSRHPIFALRSRSIFSRSRHRTLCDVAYFTEADIQAHRS